MITALTYLAPFVVMGTMGGGVSWWQRSRLRRSWRDARAIIALTEREAGRRP